MTEWQPKYLYIAFAYVQVLQDQQTSNGYLSFTKKWDNCFRVALITFIPTCGVQSKYVIEGKCT